MDDFDYYKNNKNKFIVIGLVVAVFIVFITAVLVIKSKSSENNQEQSKTEANQPETSSNFGLVPKQVNPDTTDTSITPSSPIPKTIFENYTLKTTYPNIPTSIQTYYLKTNFSLADATQLGSIFNLSQTKTTKSSTVFVYELKNQNNKGILVYNTKSGAYSFVSFGKHQLTDFGGNNINEKVLNYLQQKGLADSTISCPITYENQKYKKMVFVECHRDWEIAGLPILNFQGILNVAEDVNIKNIREGQTDSQSLPNPNIINVSDMSNGKDRPTDFNTITVVVQNDQIISIDSNLRQIKRTVNINMDDLIGPQEALSVFSTHKAENSLIMPSGKGTVISSKIFPNNIAHSKNATVTDYVLTYLENSPHIAQSTFEPYYLIKGYAELSSGYRAKFTEVVPATKSKNISVLGENDANEPVIKLGDFDPEFPESAEIEPTIAAEVVAAIDKGGICKPTEDELSPIYDLENFGRLGYYINHINIPMVGEVENFVADIPAYYLIPNSNTLPNIDSVTNEVSSLLSSIGAATYGEMGIRRRVFLDREWSKWDGSCPIRLTGPSPTIFVYSAKNTTVKVSRPITYSDPPHQNNKWVVKPNNNSLLINDLTRSYIYYEYLAVNFSKPRTGWVIKKSELIKFNNNIAGTIGLNKDETKRLFYELNQATLDISNDYLFIGLINNKEVSEKINLKAEPKTSEILRYHFYIEGIDAPFKINKPVLRKVTQRKSLILELGAISKNN